MKTKTMSAPGGKFYLFAIALFFVSVFFVQVDGVKNIAKADNCNSDCIASYGESFCVQENFCLGSAADPNYGPQQPTAADPNYGPQQPTSVADPNYGPQQPTAADPNYGPQQPTSVDTSSAACQNIISLGGTAADCAPSAVTSNSITYSECMQGGGNEAICGEFYGAPASAVQANSISAASAGSCVNSDACGGGYTCYQGQCIDDTTLADNTSLSERTANGVKNLTNSNVAPTQAQTPAEKKAADDELAKKNAAALGARGVQESAAQTASKSALAVKTVCAAGDAAACTAAQAAAVADDIALRKANADLQAAMLAAANANPGSNNSGGSSGLNFSANGINGPVYDQGQYPNSGGTYNPIGQNGSNSGLGPVAGVGGVTSAKCGTNFKEIGGVCFPDNTGLSAAPIYVILSNLFSWLMLLFTTLAVVAFVVSGIQYVTAAGSQDQMEAGKRNAQYAILGIIIGLSGFVIIKAISGALAGQGYFF